MRFENKVVFITGGAVGFGRVFARSFAAEGASIVIADIDGPAGDATAAALRADGAKALAVECDVADSEHVDEAVRRATVEFGGVDVLLNNAGKHLTKYAQPFTVLGREEARALFDVNVHGIINCTLSCQPSMKERGGGAIINISSIAGFMPSSPYGVSKLAVRGLTMAFATELSADRIRVNAIAPGLMATENALLDLPQALVDRFVGELQLVKRLGQMDDIAKTVLFLCSEDASFITGETVKVSGGYPLHI